MSWDWLAYAAVVVVGAGVGIGELVSRYRDAPVRAIRTGPAALYIGVNAVAAVSALAIIRAFGWSFGIAETDATQLTIVQGLVASFGAMALFRSSLFTVRIGEDDVSVGPNSLLQVILDASDRGVDRERATDRAREVALAMAGVSFERGHVAIPTLCLGLMQNLSAELQADLAEEVKKLREADLDDSIKSLVLGLKLMNVVGDGVVRGAIASLGPRIRRAHEISLEPVENLIVGAEHRLQARILDPNGLVLPGDLIAWHSSDVAVVTVTAQGTVTAHAAGGASITAALDGIRAAVPVTVIDRRPSDGITVEEVPGTRPPPLLEPDPPGN